MSDEYIIIRHENIFKIMFCEGNTGGEKLQVHSGNRNPGPLPPKGGIIPLDQTDSILKLALCLIINHMNQNYNFGY